MSPDGFQVQTGAQFLEDKRAEASGFGKALKSRFKGWRAAIITTDKALAQATGLPFKPPGPPVLHGGLRVQLWQTGVLK